MRWARRESNAEVDDYRRTLRKLTVRDDHFISTLLQSDQQSAALSGLDPRAHALARLGSLIALGAAEPDYMSAVDSAVAAGATHVEIVGVLIAVLPLVGVARVVSAAPHLGLAVGYDVAAALEGLEDVPAP